MKLVDTPKHSKYGKHGFVCAIQFDKNDGGISHAKWLKINDLESSCRKTLGKEYMINRQRPGKKNKWANQQCRTFVRYHFKSTSARLLAMMGM